MFRDDSYFRRVGSLGPIGQEEPHRSDASRLVGHQRTHLLGQTNERERQ